MSGGADGARPAAQNDLDLGASGAIVIKDNHIITGGKQGPLYIVNAANLGGYDPNANNTNVFQARPARCRACCLVLRAPLLAQCGRPVRQVRAASQRVRAPRAAPRRAPERARAPAGAQRGAAQLDQPHRAVRLQRPRLLARQRRPGLHARPPLQPGPVQARGWPPAPAAACTPPGRASGAARRARCCAITPMPLRARPRGARAGTPGTAPPASCPRRPPRRPRRRSACSPRARPTLWCRPPAQTPPRLSSGRCAAVRLGLKC
jgi:hypothetical protein